METATPEEKPLMIVGVNGSEHSYYALEWALDHFFTPYAPDYPFKLLLVHAKPTPSSALGLAGPAEAAEVLPYIEADLKRTSARVIGKSKKLCLSKLVNDVSVEVVEGDARSVLCEAVEKHHGSMLVLGSHGHGVVKRVFLGSVSDYCSHHAHCSVVIVKRPKTMH